MRRVWWMGVAALLALGACGGDDSNEPASTEASESDVAEDQAVADAALFVASDFPDDWTAEERSSDAEDRATGAEIAACAGVDDGDLLDFGGALAESPDFGSPDGEHVTNRVGFAATEDEASERLAALGDAGDCIADVYQRYLEESVEGSDTEIGEVTSESLDIAPQGDETVAFRVTVPVINGGSEAEVYIDVVAFRAGRAMATMQAQSEVVPFDPDETERYAALIAERLAQE